MAAANLEAQLQPFPLMQHLGSSNTVARSWLCLPPQTPFSPSPISDRNTRGSLNSMASMTCIGIDRDHPVRCNASKHHVDSIMVRQYAVIAKDK